ncbi:MAG: protein kinase [Pirellulaceae bacterium]|nr:protein kinase [Pirellulaceae bacterium]
MRFTFPSGATPLAGYTIKRGLGIGGFGEVYFAVSDSGKEVALKRIARNLEVELRGVRQCLNLKHPNLIDLWDIQLDDHGESWVVMEFVPGPSLKDLISDHPNGMQSEDAAWWFAEISAGVHYLHQNGIVHRDLKPGNIFHDSEADLVKIGDYGLSKFISCSRRSGHTESVGTVHYMAPEIGRGVYGREIDIYSMGIMLHELLTGRLPFDGESSQEIIMKHLTATPDVSGLPEPFARVVLKALVKDPEQRYRTILEMLSDLPENYWPSSLKRSQRPKLDDTASHPGLNGPGQIPRDAGDRKNLAALEAPARPSQVAPFQPAPILQQSPASQEPVASGTSESPNSTTMNRSVPVLGRHRFNQPPSPTTSAPTPLPVGLAPGSNPQVGAGLESFDPALPRPVVNRSAAQSLYERFSRSAGDIVFGEVQFHDVVEAEMVFTEPAHVIPSEIARPTVDAAATPDYAAKHAAALNQLPNRGREPLTSLERQRLAVDSRVQAATVPYLQQVSGADQLAGMLTGMLIAAAISAMAAIAGFYFLVSDSNSILPSQREDVLAIMMWLWICSFGSLWVLLSVSRLWTSADRQTGWRRWTMVPVAIGMAGFAWGSAQGLQIDFSPILMHRNYFDQGYLGELLFTNHQPNLAAFVVFFVGLIMLGGWSRQVNPLRARRFRWLSLLRVCGLCFMFASLLNFDWPVGLILGVALSVGAQWSAPYFTDRQRRELRDLAARSV